MLCFEPIVKNFFGRGVDVTEEMRIACILGRGGTSRGRRCEGSDAFNLLGVRKWACEKD